MGPAPLGSSWTGSDHHPCLCSHPLPALYGSSPLSDRNAAMSPYRRALCCQGTARALNSRSLSRLHCLQPFFLNALQGVLPPSAHPGQVHLLQQQGLSHRRHAHHFSSHLRTCRSCTQGVAISLMLTSMCQSAMHFVRTQTMTQNINLVIRGFLKINTQTPVRLAH